MEREEFYRLKKIQEKKKKIKDAREKELEALKAAGLVYEAGNLIEDEHDDDILF